MPGMAARTEPKKKKGRKVKLSPAEENARKVLIMSARLLGQTNEAIAQHLDRSTQWVQQRRVAETRIRLGTDDIAIADALDIPPSLFTMDPLDAGSWLLNNRTEQVIASFGWSSEFPSLALSN